VCEYRRGPLRRACLVGAHVPSSVGGSWCLERCGGLGACSPPVIQYTAGSSWKSSVNPELALGHHSRIDLGQPQPAHAGIYMSTALTAVQHSVSASEREV
jgi:hypothetical protein